MLWYVSKDNLSLAPSNLRFLSEAERKIPEIPLFLGMTLQRF